MPTVAKTTVAVAKASVIITNNQITQAQLTEFNEKMAELEVLKDKLKPLESFVKMFKAKVLELATGLNEEGYKAKPLDEVSALMDERLEQKLFSVEKGKLDFELDYSDSPKRNVSWKDQFIRLTSESKALEVQNATPYSYCYKVIPIEV